MTEPVRPPFPPRDSQRPDWMETLAPQPTQQDAGMPTPGTTPEYRLGHYRLLRQLGQGGMGTVYLAHDERLGRQVALKVPHFADDPGNNALERFRREAKAAASLDNPNICGVYEIGEDRGVHFFVMPFIDGKALSAYIQEGKRLSPAQVATLVRKIALALAEAHERGIIHRDLKPSNVMVNKRGEPVIMDFGLVRRIDQTDGKLTHSGALLGTPAYMSPEQARGDPDAVTHLSDVYSLGVILFELLTLRVPFVGKAGLVLSQVLSETPPKPSAIWASVDPRLEAICVKAMARKPKDRYAGMGEFANALAQFLRDIGASTRVEARTGDSATLPQGIPAPPAFPQAIPIPAPEPPPAAIPVAVAAPSVTQRHPRPAQRRSRLWLYAGGVALLGVLAIVLIVALRPAKKPGVSHYLPENTTFVMAVDFQQLLDSPLVKQYFRGPLEASIKNNKLAQQVFLDMGIDPLRDVQRMILSGDSLEPQGARYFAMLEGRFDPARLRVLWGQTMTLTRVPGEKGGEYEVWQNVGLTGTAHYGILGDSALVFAVHRDDLVQALEKAAGRRKTTLPAGKFRDALDGLAPGQSAWMVIDGGARSGGVRMADMIGCEVMVGGLTLTDELKGHVWGAVAEGRSPQAFNDEITAELIQAGRSLAQLSERQPALAPLAQQVSKVRGEVRGQEVHYQVHVPADVLRKLLDSLPLDAQFKDLGGELEKGLQPDEITAAAIRFNDELVGLMNRLGEAKVKFANATANLDKAEAPVAVVNAALAELRKEVEAVEEQMKGLKEQPTATGRAFAAAFRDLAGVYRQLVEKNVPEVIRLAEDAQLPPADRVKRIVEVFDAVDRAEQKGIKGVQDTQKEFAREHKILLR